MGDDAIFNVLITDKKIIAEDIVSLKLSSLDGKNLPPYKAGAHIDVHLPSGIIRQYSLCGTEKSPSDYEIAVLRDPASRGGSLEIHHDFKIGDIIKISSPRNFFPLVDEKVFSILFAGGIGITPILSMAHELDKQNREFAMHYCSRSIARTAFYEQIKSSSFSGKVNFHFDDMDDAQKLDATVAINSAPKNTHIYICGPSAFIEYIISISKNIGVDEKYIHREFFGAQIQNIDSNTSFKVKINSSGEIYDIPADKSICNVLDENGVFIPVSCEQGVCGTCLTKIIEGIPEHNDYYLTPEEQELNDAFTPCCSRAKTEFLILDL